MARPRWYVGIEPREAVIDCLGAAHRIRWDRGRLTLHDHHDLEGERVLSALGGVPPPCLAYLQAVEAARTVRELRSMLLHSSPLLARQPLAAGRPPRAATSPPSPPPARRPHATVVQHTISATAQISAVGSGTLVPSAPRLGPMAGQLPRAASGGRMAFQFHHIASLQAVPDLLDVVRDICRVADERRWRIGDPDADGRWTRDRRRGHLEALITRVATAALEQWARRAVASPLGSATFHASVVVVTSGSASITGSIDARGGLLIASLPLSWWRRVGRRGLAAVDSCFVLDTEDDPVAGHYIDASVCTLKRVVGPALTPVIHSAIAVRAGARWCVDVT